MGVNRKRFGVAQENKYVQVLVSGEAFRMRAQKHFRRLGIVCVRWAYIPKVDEYRSLSLVVLRPGSVFRGTYRRIGTDSKNNLG